MTPVNERPNAERRRELRFPTAGPVELSTSDPVLNVFHGDLLDSSQSGFRVRHRNLGLQVGQRVHYRHQSGEGAARVMWTRIAGGQIESGFLVSES